MTTNESDFLHFLRTRSLDMSFIGKYGIPELEATTVKNLDKVDLLGFNSATRADCMRDRQDCFIHFYLPDSYIERVWDVPDYYEGVFNQYKGIIQPDLSLYTTMPRAMQIWNHYRNMWLGRFFQLQGLTVIPSVTWSDEESYDWCFDGMPVGSCLCVSTVGCVKNPKVRALFNKGFGEALKRLKPKQLILYGVIDDDIRSRVKGIPYVHVESEMKQRIRKYEEAK